MVGPGVIAGNAASGPATPQVLRVGTWQGIAGTYTTIASAVAVAKPGDWVLVAPGDYHEQMDHAAPDFSHATGGVEITTPDLHLRGMDRNGVVIDGTKPGSPQCSSAPGDQDFGVTDPSNKPAGRNGVLIWKADNVSVDNLTVCNFLNGHDDAGNEVWWDGGDGSGQIGLSGYWSNYVTTTSTYYDESTAAAYGIFSSNSAGPATWDHVYASNFNDSGAYVGACHQVCDIVIDHSKFEYNALGYSGTNSGGAIVIQNSEFDHNEDGLDTNTSYSGDPTAPQDGACPDGAVSPITHTSSCWTFQNNNVHDNNNADTPSAGSAAAGPYGTGMTISGGRNNTVMNNTFSNNGAWGVLFVPYPDGGSPVLGQSCTGLGGAMNPLLGCVFEASGNALLNNTFVNNGYFGNPSNSDYGQIVLNGGHPQNCFAGNIAPDGSAPTDLETIQPACGPTQVAGNTGGDLLVQVLCDSRVDSALCPEGSNYPTPSAVVMRPLPNDLPTMPNPCVDVPTNPWCPAAVVTSTTTSTPPSTSVPQVTTVPTAPVQPSSPVRPAVAISAEPKFTG